MNSLRQINFFVEWHINFLGLSNDKAILIDTVVLRLNPLLEGDQKVHAFAMGICPKVNVIVRLEFELAYYDVVVRYATRTDRQTDTKTDRLIDR